MKAPFLPASHFYGLNVFTLKFSRFKHVHCEISPVSHLQNIGGIVFEAGLSLTTVTFCLKSM